MADFAGENAVANMTENMTGNMTENLTEDMTGNLTEDTVENASEAEAPVVSRREYEQALGALAEAEVKLRRAEAAHEVERELERLLREAGAKNQQAVRGLLPLDELLGLEELPEGWQASLQQQVADLQADPETAFLFAEMPDGMNGWVGFVPTAADEIDQSEGGFRLRLAQARGEQDSLAAIRVKQEAAARGVFL